MKLHEERVIAERDELEGKVRKLITFRASPTHEALDGYDKLCLKNQLWYMEGYLNSLNIRIEKFSA